jgi:hypothetical protein
VGRSVPAQAASIAHVELRLAGTFGVVRDGRELADREIGSRKSRTAAQAARGGTAGVPGETLAARPRPAIIAVIDAGGRLGRRSAVRASRNAR